jgi:hypothetical protein
VKYIAPCPHLSPRSLKAQLIPTEIESSKIPLWKIDPSPPQKTTTKKQRTKNTSENDVRGEVSIESFWLFPCPTMKATTEMSYLCTKTFQ